MDSRLLFVNSWLILLFTSNNANNECYCLQNDKEQQPSKCCGSARKEIQFNKALTLQRDHFVSFCVFHFCQLALTPMPIVTQFCVVSLEPPASFLSWVDATSCCIGVGRTWFTSYAGYVGIRKCTLTRKRMSLCSTRAFSIGRWLNCLISQIVDYFLSHDNLSLRLSNTISRQQWSWDNDNLHPSSRSW